MLISRSSTQITPFNGVHPRIVISTSIETPLGLMYAAAIEEGICLLEFADSQRSDESVTTIENRFEATLRYGDSPHLNTLKIQLNEYFNKEREYFEVPIVLSGTNFQNKVFKALQTIPYGETRSYTQLACKIDHPTAARAVATANASNTLAIIVPCHRVIGSDRSLKGYAGGIERKQFLLDLEESICL